MKTWYLSFCNADKPRGERFISACLLELEDWATAQDVIQEAWLHGCNPGGDVAIFDITSQWAALPADHLARSVMKFNTRITLDQLKTLGPVHFH